MKVKHFSMGIVVGLLVGLLVGGASFAIAGNAIKLIVNGTEVKSDVPPQVINGRTLVPARALAEALGASVSWDGANNAVVIKSGTSNLLQGTVNVVPDRQTIISKKDLPYTVNAKNGMKLTINNYSATTTGIKFNITLTNTSMTDKGQTMTTSWTIYDGKNTLKSISQDDAFYDNWLSLHAGQSITGDTVYEGLSYNASTFYWEIRLSNGINYENFKLKFNV